MGGWSAKWREGSRLLCLFQTPRHSKLGLRREQGSAVTGFQKGLLCQVVIDLASLVNVHSGPIIAQSVQRCGLISTICRIDKSVSNNTHWERLTEVGNIIIILNFQNWIYFHIWWLPNITILAMRTCPYLAILTSGSRTTADPDHHGLGIAGKKRIQEKATRPSTGNCGLLLGLWWLISIICLSCFSFVFFQEILSRHCKCRRSSLIAMAGLDAYLSRSLMLLILMNTNITPAQLECPGMLWIKPKNFDEYVQPMPCLLLISAKPPHSGVWEGFLHLSN